MKQAIIFTNGAYGSLDFYAQYLEEKGPFDIIGCDGGINCIARLGKTPVWMTGDMDSVDPAVLSAYMAKGIPADKHSTHKDETDTELAVDYCLANHYERVVLCGASGSRLDHTLGNFYLLNKMLEAGIWAETIDPVNRIFLMTDYCQLDVPVGSTVSIMAYTDKAEGITLEGFEYPVYNGMMDHLRPGYGISNVTVAKKPEIWVKQGKLLVDIVTE